MAENVSGALRRYLPVLSWGRQYRRDQAVGDLVAALIVTIMLVPQSLAYALLAGLPAEMGLYASILPILLYAIFGTSRALAVGPVAVVSLMTAAAAGRIAATGTPDYILAALTLAFLSGLMLMALGFLRLGFLANFLSHPVIAGFIPASGVLIATKLEKLLLWISSGRMRPRTTSSARSGSATSAASTSKASTVACCGRRRAPTSLSAPCARAAGATSTATASTGTSSESSCGSTSAS